MKKALILLCGVSALPQMALGTSKCGGTVIEEGCMNGNFIPDDFVDFYWSSGSGQNEATKERPLLSREAEALIAGIAAIPFLGDFAIPLNFLQIANDYHNSGLADPFQSWVEGKMDQLFKLIYQIDYETQIDDISLHFSDAENHFVEYMKSREIYETSTDNDTVETFKENAKNYLSDFAGVCGLIHDFVGDRSIITGETYMDSVRLLVWPTFCEMCFTNIIPVLNSSNSLDEKSSHLRQFEEGFGSYAIPRYELCSTGAAEMAQAFYTSLQDVVRTDYGNWEVTCSQLEGGIESAIIRRESRVAIARQRNVETIKYDVAGRLFFRADRNICEPPPSSTNQNRIVDICACRNKERVQFPAYQILQKKIFSMAHRNVAAQDRTKADRIIQVNSLKPFRIREIQIFAVDGSKVPILFAHKPGDDITTDIERSYYPMFDGDMTTSAAAIEDTNDSLYKANFEFGSDIEIAEIRVSVNIAYGDVRVQTSFKGEDLLTVGRYNGGQSNFIVRPHYNLINRNAIYFVSSDDPNPGHQFVNYHLQITGGNNDILEVLPPSDIRAKSTFNFELTDVTSSIVNMICTSDDASYGKALHFTSENFFNFADVGETGFSVMRHGPDDNTYLIRSKNERFLKPRALKSGRRGQQSINFVDTAAHFELQLQVCGVLCTEEYTSNAFQRLGQASTTSSSTAVIGGAIAGTFALLVAVGGVVARRRRQSPQLDDAAEQHASDDASPAGKDIATDVEQIIDPATDF